MTAMVAVSDGGRARTNLHGMLPTRREPSIGGPPDEGPVAESRTSRFAAGLRARLSSGDGGGSGGGRRSPELAAHPHHARRPADAHHRHGRELTSRSAHGERRLFCFPLCDSNGCRQCLYRGRGALIEISRGLKVTLRVLASAGASGVGGVGPASRRQRHRRRAQPPQRRRQGPGRAPGPHQQLRGRGGRRRAVGGWQQGRQQRERRDRSGSAAQVSG